MSGLYILGGVIAAGLLVYLVAALLYPEKLLMTPRAVPRRVVGHHDTHAWIVLAARRAAGAGVAARAATSPA